MHIFVQSFKFYILGIQSLQNLIKEVPLMRMEYCNAFTKLSLWKRLNTIQVVSLVCLYGKFELFIAKFCSKTVIYKETFWNVKPCTLDNHGHPFLSPFFSLFYIPDTLIGDRNRRGPPPKTRCSFKISSSSKRKIERSFCPKWLCKTKHC